MQGCNPSQRLSATTAAPASLVVRRSVRTDARQSATSVVHLRLAVRANPEPRADSRRPVARQVARSSSGYTPTPRRSDWVYRSHRVTQIDLRPWSPRSFSRWRPTRTGPVRDTPGPYRRRRPDESRPPGNVSTVPPPVAPSSRAANTSHQSPCAPARVRPTLRPRSADPCRIETYRTCRLSSSPHPRNGVPGDPRRCHRPSGTSTNGRSSGTVIATELSRPGPGRSSRPKARFGERQSQVRRRDRGRPTRR
jgi:hypothetical protein